ncbi:G1 family glutamic endopeptidase [Frankia sp. Cr2]|uniref:G1 family glutamic endopeptidase n=1 Tax=Frankia sp. Cr2 TaxID=3073932 RepID=UPI002AD370E0|nr:G1 family glutamic endopeptidase [Frankia sp. Cr2]
MLTVGAAVLVTLPFSHSASAKVGGIVKDSGFESQTTRAIAAPWGFEGIDPKGVDVGIGLENTGRNNAWIRAASRQWNSITQVVKVTPNTTYALSAWVRTSGNFDGGYLGARSGDNRTILNEVRYGPAGANPAAYQYLSTEFNSGPNTSAIVFVGYLAPGVDSWVQIDDVDLGGVYSNWAGYAQVSDTRNVGPMRRVEASWIQPKFSCGSPSTNSVGVWVGLGGFNTSDQESLVQIGTAATCITGDYPATIYASQDAFWEVVDGGRDTKQQSLGLPVFPGDLITAVIAANPIDTHTYVLFISNETRGGSRTLVKTAPHSRNLSAEVIVERPKSSSIEATWPTDLEVNFGNVRFDGKAPNAVRVTPIVAINNQLTREYGPTGITGPGQDGFTVRSRRPLVSYPTGPFVSPRIRDVLGPLIQRP